MVRNFDFLAITPFEEWRLFGKVAILLFFLFVFQHGVRRYARILMFYKKRSWNFEEDYPFKETRLFDPADDNAGYEAKISNKSAVYYAAPAELLFEFVIIIGIFWGFIT